MPVSPARRRKPVTVREVAQRAGVSPATVSRSLAGDPAISEATRERVVAAARQLNYRPHAGARSLRTRSSQLIGVLVPSSGDGFYGAVVSGVEQRARERGYHVLLAMSHADPEREREAFEVFLSQRVDAVVAVSPIGDAETMAVPGSAGLPSAIINWDPAVAERTVRRVATGATRGLDSVVPPMLPIRGEHIGFDDRGGGQLATQHLLDLGHRRLVFVGGAPTRSSLLRLLAFRGAVTAAGLWPQPVLLPEPTMTARQAAVADLLRTLTPPVGVVAYDDLTAISVLRAADEVGWSVPDDLSVVGTDDIEMAQYTRPALTTVAQPSAEYGELAVDAVLALRPLGDQLVAGRLVERASTAPVRRRRGGRAR